MFIEKEKHIQVLERMDEYSSQISGYIPYLINILNDSYWYLWNQPDDVLVKVLQYLLDNNLLRDTFNKHYVLGTEFNTIAKELGQNADAITVAGRQFNIVDGKVVLVPMPDPGVNEPSPIE